MTIVTCPTCGAKNRVDERLAQLKTPVCGKCGAKLNLNATTGGPIEASDQTLSQLLQSAGDRPVLVDCWAAWCGPCRMIAPTIDQLAAEASGRWLVAKLDVDRNPLTAQRFGIDSIPALLIFRNGKMVDKLVGVQPKQAIVSRLSSS